MKASHLTSLHLPYLQSFLPSIPQSLIQSFLPSILQSLFFLLPLAALPAQRAIQLTLPEVVEVARDDSPAARLAETRQTNNYWRYRSYLADFKPQVTFDAVLPNLNRSIEGITLPDGREDFISRSLMRNSVGLSIAQPIALTGGSVFVFSGLRRLDVFKSELSDGSVSYLSTPVSVGITQPLRTFNELKWDRRIEPLRYQEQQRVYNESREEAATRAADLFFDLLIAQINLRAAQTNKINADTLYAISQGRFSVGRIAETDLLQIELSVMNANSALAQAALGVQRANEELRAYLGITDDVEFDLVTPEEIPEFAVDPEEALRYAQQYRSEVLGFERRFQEAASDLDRAVKSNGFGVNLQAEFGLNGTSQEFDQAYQGLLDQQVVTLGIQVPIADFGKAKSRIEVARSNQELEQLNIDQERISLERQVRIQVDRMDLLRSQINLAERAYEVAVRREDITRKRYLIGKIAVTELNLAVREMDEARRQYVSGLRDFWLGYYQLRRLTLYDFIGREVLILEQ